MKVTEVLVKVLEPGRLRMAWQPVRKHAGAAGIDRMTVAEFAQREEAFLALIHDKLTSGSYRFQPARRVLIPKQGTSGMRKLGIPVVMDRVVGARMHGVLEEIFDPQFTASNFGFRRGRSQHQAIRPLQRRVKEGREWAVAIDRKSFFDEIPHGLILQLIRRKVADEQFVTLLARLLKAGVVVNGEFEKTTKGCPQGSPLSPILSNIVLNELDHKLEERNLGYCRWADDFVIVARRNNPLSMYYVIHGLSEYLRGWVGDFGIQEFKYLFRDLDAWIRSRLRSTQLKKWKKPGKFQRTMIKAGFDPQQAHRVWIRMNRWQSVMRRPVRFVMNLDWFRDRGLVFLHDFTLAFSRT
jgi:RNA-directed DNA polymerase